jgi:hypothetical protein
MSKPENTEPCTFVFEGMKVWAKFKNAGWQECTVVKAAGDLAWIKAPGVDDRVRAVTLDLLRMLERLS